MKFVLSILLSAILLTSLSGCAGAYIGAGVGAVSLLYFADRNEAKADSTVAAQDTTGQKTQDRQAENTQKATRVATAALITGAAIGVLALFALTLSASPGLGD